MKILFLDFDGVIRVGRSPDYDHTTIDFQPEQIRLIKTICDRTGAQIVVTSDLRFSLTREQFDVILPTLTPYFHRHEWRTPKNFDREEEIRQWMLETNNYFKISHFAVIDDQSRLFPRLSKKGDNLFITNNRFGLQLKTAIKIINHLNK